MSIKLCSWRGLNSSSEGENYSLSESNVGYFAGLQKSTTGIRDKKQRGSCLVGEPTRRQREEIDPCRTSDFSAVQFPRPGDPGRTQDPGAACHTACLGWLIGSSAYSPLETGSWSLQNHSPISGSKFACQQQLCAMRHATQQLCSMRPTTAEARRSLFDLRHQI
jgi:hypothetical protein